MTSLRAQLLFGIVVANVAALSALGFVVGRDLERQRQLESQQRAVIRGSVVDRVKGLFEAMLGQIDFGELDQPRAERTEFFRRVLAQPHWQWVQDAMIVKQPTLFGEHAVAANIEFNPLGVPDEESEARRARARRVMSDVYRGGVSARLPDDIVVIPLYSGGFASRLRRLRDLAAGLVASLPSLLDPADPATLPTAAEYNVLRYGTRALREEIATEDAPSLWGAAYIRVAVPPIPDAGSGIDLPVIALAIGGATVLAIASLWLLLRRLVLEPLERVSAAAVAVSGGALATRLSATGDSPEIDALISNFNRMTAELAESRGALERRVEEALAKLRESEKRLVLNERLAAMGTLAAGVAHEINNPLGGMQNAIATLRRKGERDEGTKRYLGLIEDGLARMRDVVERVLRFSPGRSKRGEAPLATIVEDAARFVRHRVRERRAELIVRVDPSLVFRGDGPALGQVFLNLFLNALDALESRAEGESRRIEVEGSRAGDFARVTVTDTGSGMPPEQCARVFDLFFTTKPHGTGLGLSIAHQIVTEHGGSIQVTSTVGVGTTFELRLPLSG